MSTPAVAALTRMTAGWAAAPRILTISPRPAAGLLPHMLGQHAVANLVLADDGPLLLAGGDETVFADVAAAAMAARDWAGAGLMLRFVDSATVATIEASVPDLLTQARAIWLQLRAEHAPEEVARRLAALGFDYRITLAQPPVLLLSRDAVSFDPAPRYRARPAMETLVIVDNNLTGERGHYLSVASRIASGAIEAGVQPLLATHRRFEPASAPAGVPVEQVFEASIFDIAPANQADADLSDDFARGLGGLLDRHDTPGTHFLVPTTDGHHIRAVDRLLADRALSGVLHLATPYETRHMPGRTAGREIDWHLRHLAASPLFGRQLFLWGETRPLAALHAARLGIDVCALPLPAPEAIVGMGPAEDAPLTLAFLGEARLDKGVLELAGIARAALAAVPAGRVRIVVQLVPPHGGYSDEMAAAAEELRGIAGVEIVDQVLSDAGYQAALLAADAVLLPYRRENYAFRGSGILTEALAAGRVVLSHAGTIAADMADEGRVILCDTPQDWSGATAALLADLPAVRAAAANAGHRFRKRNAPRAFVDRLAMRAEFA